MYVNNESIIINSSPLRTRSTASFDLLGRYGDPSTLFSVHFNGSCLALHEQ